MMVETFKEEMILFAKKSSLQLDVQALLTGSRFEIEDGLSLALHPNGVVLYSETGVPPSEYLPSVIDDYLDLLEGKPWSLDNIVTENAWQSADVILKHKDESYLFSINNINGNDWVAEDLAMKLHAFSIEKCDKTLITFCSDDPFLILALPHEIAAELKRIIEYHSTAIE